MIKELFRKPTIKMYRMGEIIEAPIPKIMNNKNLREIKK